MKSVTRFVAGAAILVLSYGRAGAHDHGYNWQGLYLGGHGSWMSAGTEYLNSTTPRQAFDGAMLGGQIGYNWQAGSLVLGVEADLSFGRVEDFIRDGNFLTHSGAIDRMGTLRGRVGYAFDNVMPYVTGGLVWANLAQGSACPVAAAAGICTLTGPFDVKSTETFRGWVIGGGIEWGISRHWSIKGEALFGRFGDERYVGTLPVVGTVVAPVGLNLDTIVRAGVNYRF